MATFYYLFFIKRSHALDTDWPRIGIGIGIGIGESLTRAHYYAE